MGPNRSSHWHSLSRDKHHSLHRDYFASHFPGSPLSGHPKPLTQTGLTRHQCLCDPHLYLVPALHLLCYTFRACSRLPSLDKMSGPFLSPYLQKQLSGYFVRLPAPHRTELCEAQVRAKVCTFPGCLESSNCHIL